MNRSLLFALATLAASTAWGANELYRTSAVNSRVLYDNHYDCTLIAYDDGSYKIDQAFGEGWDLEFTVNDDGTLHFTNLPADPTDPEVYVWYKDLWGSGYDDYFYQDAKSSITGDADGGIIRYYSCWYEDYTCVWGDPVEVDRVELWRKDAVNSRDLYGNTYNCTLIHYEDGGYLIQGAFGDDWDLEFTLNDDGTLHFTNLPADPDDPEVYVWYKDLWGPGYQDYFYQDNLSSMEGDMAWGKIHYYSCYYTDYTCQWGDEPEIDWVAKATYSQDKYGKAWNCNFVSYTDGSYSIEGAFETDARICFTVNDDGTLHFTNLPADPTDLETYVYLQHIFGTGYHDYYYQDAYSSISGDNMGGTAKIYSCWYEDYTCTWQEVSGISDIDNDDNALIEYYNLQGMRVNENNMQPGIYIMRQGKKATKKYISK